MSYYVITVKFIDFEPFSALLRRAGGAAGVLGGAAAPLTISYLAFKDELS